MSEISLRRYTDLAALIYMLSEKKITLVDPRNWDDVNDSHYLALYREKRALTSVLALCFTKTDETYHHWRVFGSGTGGVCITFKAAALKGAVKSIKGLRADRVRYRTLRGRRGETLATRDLPFLKRYAFKPDREFRLVYESATEDVSHLDIPVPLSCIERVTLSPWLRARLAPSVVALLRSIPGCEGLKIVRSTLINNEEWKALGEGAAEPAPAPGGRRPTGRTAAGDARTLLGP